MKMGRWVKWAPSLEPAALVAQGRKQHQERAAGGHSLLGAPPPIPSCFSIFIFPAQCFPSQQEQHRPGRAAWTSLAAAFLRASPLLTQSWEFLRWKGHKDNLVPTSPVAGPPSICVHLHQNESQAPFLETLLCLAASALQPDVTPA